MTAVSQFLQAMKLLVILHFIFLPRLATAKCECGYTLNSSLFTSALETDFLHFPSLTPSLNAEWQPQNYSVNATLARGPYGKYAALDNVRANSLKNQWDWAGEGPDGRDAGLQLWVTGGVPEDGLVRMAEVASLRGDMLYGTFRVGMKVTGVDGTCGAFFWVSGASSLIKAALSRARMSFAKCIFCTLPSLTLIQVLQ